MMNMLRRGIRFLRDLVSNRQLLSDAVAGRLAVAIANSIRQEYILDSRLKILAEILADLPGITGAMVVSCDDDGFPLTHGVANLSISNTLNDIADLYSIMTELPDEDWADVSTHQIKVSGAYVFRARKIMDTDITVGMILLGLLDADDISLVIAGLEKTMELIIWVIQDSSRLKEMRLIQESWKLELEEFGRLKPVYPQEIAERLKVNFCANAVTILVREQGRLYLSASTDIELRRRAKRGERVVAYNPGEGFMGFVLSTGSSIRLRNARDTREIRRLYPDINRAAESLHPEALAKPGGGSFRFLAVPMRSGIKEGSQVENDQSEEGQLKARGVIRILREEKAAPFSASEQRSLQYLADTFAIAMHSSWRLHLADAVMKAETEAVCITRNEPGKGHFIPRVVRADLGAEVLFGLNQDQFEGMDARNLYADGEYGKIQKLLDKAIDEGLSVCGPVKTILKRFGNSGYDIRSADISYRLVTSPFVQPKTHYTIAVIRDITETQLRAMQHERLVTLLDKKGLAYFLTDKDGRIAESGPTESRLTGYSRDELTGMRQSELYDRPNDRNHLIERVDQQDGRLVHTTQLFKKKDGSAFWAEGVIHKLKDESGRGIGYEGLYEDVTERIRLQGFLDVKTHSVLKERELYEKLKENAKFHLLFMTSVSHQLRSPLGALVEQLLNFQEGIVDSKLFSNRLRYAIGQARVSALLVSNLTYMDKILRGETFDFAAVNLSRLAIETKLNFEHLLYDKRLRIKIYKKSLSKHLNVWGHQELLRQVLVNLIDNAIKYSVRRSCIILSGRDSPQGSYFQITSRGLGIPKEYRTKIFERGFRMPQAEALIPAGTGLGLWLVKKIVEAHGAEVRYKQILEEGEERTAFQIFFPTRPMRRSVDSRRLA